MRFAPGDDVVCIDDGQLSPYAPLIQKGVVYVVEGWDVGACRDCIFLVGVDAEDRTPERASYHASRFRKVQRRNLTAWLAAEKTIEEPKRAPAKKRERV